MSGETEASVSGWTTDTLKQHIDVEFANIRTLLGSMDLRYQQRYDAQIKALDAALLAAEKAVQTALTAAEKAVTKAELAADKRFESVNEFRQQLNDQATTFLSRTEYAAQHDALEARVGELTDRINVFQGKGIGFTAAWGVLLGVGALITVAVTIILATR